MQHDVEHSLAITMTVCSIALAQRERVQATVELPTGKDLQSFEAFVGQVGNRVTVFIDGHAVLSVTYPNGTVVNAPLPLLPYSPLVVGLVAAATVAAAAIIVAVAIWFCRRRHQQKLSVREKINMQQYSALDGANSEVD